MSEEKTNVKPLPPFLYRAMKEWSIHCGIGFLTCLAVVVPFSRVGAGLVIGAYFLWSIGQMYTAISRLESNGRPQDVAKRMVFRSNLGGYLLFSLSVITGLYVGGFNFIPVIEVVSIGLGVIISSLIIYEISKLMGWVK